MATFTADEARKLSALLFEAREQLDMWSDVVEGRTGRPAFQPRALVDRIDIYRERYGWSPHGFGDEAEIS